LFLCENNSFVVHQTFVKSRIAKHCFNPPLTMINKWKIHLDWIK
jgi:hypothetical protein